MPQNERTACGRSFPDSGLLDGAGDGPLAEPHLVGCTARINQLQPLKEGRFNLLAVGEERFRIVSLHGGRPYLMGRAINFPLETGDKDRGYYYGADGSLFAFAHTIGYETYDGLGWYGVITQKPRT